MSFSVVFGADIVPVPNNYNQFISADLDGLFGRELLDILGQSEHLVFNLETPLTDTPSPIVKTGPNLIAPVDTVNGLAALHPSLITLANNHILDQGEEGLLSTIETLKNKDVPCIGVGRTPEDAAKPAVLVCNGKRIGVYACAEHEFSIVRDHCAGANPFDPYESLDHIEELKKHCDNVVVIYHGGKEFYRYPTPETMKRCRKMIEKGACLVLCQHTHCVGCMEEHHGGTIVYGQGNFHFDRSEDECWQTSILVRATFDTDMAVEYIPIHKAGSAVRLASDSERKEILDGFYARSEQIKDNDFVKDAFLKVAQEQISEYYGYIAGYGTNRGVEQNYTPKVLSPENLAFLFNCLNCEPHREVIMKASWAALRGQ